MANELLIDLTEETTVADDTVFAGMPSDGDALNKYTAASLRDAIGILNLNANTTLYVNPSTGSDSNPGTSESPFQTIQKAATIFSNCLSNGYTATIQLQDGTYSQSTDICGTLDGQTVTIQGNSGTPSNVVISIPSNNGVAFIFRCGSVAIKDLQIQAGDTNGFGFSAAFEGGRIDISNLIFGALGTGDAFNVMQAGVIINQSGAISLTGNFANFINIYSDSQYDQRAAITIDANITVTRMIYVNLGANYRFLSGASFGGSGTVTGRKGRCSLGANALIATPTSVPGSDAWEGTVYGTSPYGYVGASL